MLIYEEYKQHVDVTFRKAAGVTGPVQSSWISEYETYTRNLCVTRCTCFALLCLTSPARCLNVHRLTGAHEASCPCYVLNLGYSFLLIPTKERELVRVCDPETLGTPSGRESQGKLRPCWDFESNDLSVI